MFAFWKWSSTPESVAPPVTSNYQMPPYCGLSARHVYTTRLARNLRFNEGAFVVYTPPTYDETRRAPYPMLVLLHGWTDTEMTWCERGNVPGVMDRLTLTGRVEPCVVVMPLGYGDGTFPRAKFSVWQDLPRVRTNTDLFCTMLRDEVLPNVEARYNVSRDSARRVIGGVSMGGLQALVYAARTPGRFGRVLALSSALDGENLDTLLGGEPGLAPGMSAPPELQLSCGANDALLPVNRGLADWCHARGLPVDLQVTRGGHDWMTWRSDFTRAVHRLYPGERSDHAPDETPLALHI